VARGARDNAFKSLLLDKQQMAADLVSVIVPSYNKAEYIGETLVSVLAQEDVPVEVIVIDDASSDGTWQIVTGFGTRVRAYASEGNRGAAHNRNRGARLATGHYLMFLDADDVLGLGTLAPLVAALRGRTGHVAACSWKRLRREGREWVAYPVDKPLYPPGGDAVRAWLGNWYIPPCAVLWPRALFEECGGWDEELSAEDDTELMIRTLLRGTCITPADAGTAFYRYFEGGGTLSTTDSEPRARSRILAFDKLCREAEALGVLHRYRRDFGMAFFQLARTYVAPYPQLRLECLRRADHLLGRSPVPGTFPHRVLHRVLGLERKERMKMWLSRRWPVAIGRLIGDAR
jgi:glycosyltransferase involved in cell wall biosynthesis